MTADEYDIAPTLEVVKHFIIPERVRQLQAWGQQSLPDGTGHTADRSAAQFYRLECDAKAVDGSTTWRDVFAEEYHEALAETDEELLVAELAQVVTVGVAWIEDILNRARDRAAVIQPDPVLDARPDNVRQLFDNHTRKPEPEGAA